MRKTRTALTALAAITALAACGGGGPAMPAGTAPEPASHEARRFGLLMAPTTCVQACTLYDGGASFQLGDEADDSFNYRVIIGNPLDRGYVAFYIHGIPYIDNGPTPTFTGTTLVITGTMEGIDSGIPFGDYVITIDTAAGGTKNFRFDGNGTYDIAIPGVTITTFPGVCDRNQLPV